MRVLKPASLILLALTIAACSTEPTSTPPADTNGFNYGVQAFRIRPGMVVEIKERHLQTVNNLRLSQGLPELQFSPQLASAAQRHAQDIFVQERAWHFGSDGSSPLDRAVQAGFTGEVIGENVSETYEDDQVTLQAWLREPNSRSIILDPDARFIALEWHQQQNAKIWWVQLVGGAEPLDLPLN